MRSLSGGLLNALTVLCCREHGFKTYKHRSTVVSKVYYLQLSVQLVVLCKSCD